MSSRWARRVAVAGPSSRKRPSIRIRTGCASARRAPGPGATAPLLSEICDGVVGCGVSIRWIVDDTEQFAKRAMHQILGDLCDSIVCLWSWPTSDPCVVLLPAAVHRSMHRPNLCKPMRSKTRWHESGRSWRTDHPAPPTRRTRQQSSPRACRPVSTPRCSVLLVVLHTRPIGHRGHHDPSPGTNRLHRPSAPVLSPPNPLKCFRRRAVTRCGNTLEQRRYEFGPELGCPRPRAVAAAEPATCVSTPNSCRADRGDQPPRCHP